MASTTQTKKNLTKARNEAKQTLGQVHDTVLTTTDELIDGIIETGEKWQKLFAKALKNSKPILNKQVDIIFDGIETLQVQMKDGNKRIKKLTGVDPQKVASQVEDKVKEETNKIISLVQRTAQKAEDTVEESFKAVEKRTKLTAKKAKKVAVKAETKAKSRAKTTAKKAKKAATKTQSKAKTTAKKAKKVATKVESKAKTTAKKAKKTVRRAVKKAS